TWNFWRWVCSPPSPKKPWMVARLWVPLIHSLVARQVNRAPSGASVSAARAPSRASTLTPLLAGTFCRLVFMVIDVAPGVFGLGFDGSPSARRNSGRPAWDPAWEGPWYFALRSGPELTERPDALQGHPGRVLGDA